MDMKLTHYVNKKRIIEKPLKFFPAATAKILYLPAATIVLLSSSSAMQTHALYQNFNLEKNMYT